MNAARQRPAWREPKLEQAAVSAGLVPVWNDAFGRRSRVAPDTLRALLEQLHVDPRAPTAPPRLPALIVTDAARAVLKVPAQLCRNARRACVETEHGGRHDCAVVADAAHGTIRLPRMLPSGYHHVDIGGARVPFAAAPARCFSIADALGAGDRRAWGIAAQLYGLRRADDFGIGDFGALVQLARAAAEHGADALAISPVHALFGANPDRYSPYAPSNRCFLNPLYADARVLVDATAFARLVSAAGATAELTRLRRARLIDWPASAGAHRAVFERLFARFVAGEIGGAAAFARFRAEGGNALEQHACFEALQEYRRASADAAPEPAAHSSGALAFAHANGQRVAFHAFLQWCAARGLAAAHAAARSAGMGIGLIADLAVGVDPRGSECWARPADMLIGASIGAPPDQLNALGQDWGLTTFSPSALLHTGYAPFLEILRAAMRHAGGVRIDHVMGLARLWLVPRGARAVDGAYVRYPFADLLRLVALESWRNRCIVVGEDLGTVPDDWRRRLARAGILGLDVLAFMRAGEAFIAPRRWRRDAVAMTSTHDVAPVAGWWRARDLDWRSRLRLFGESGEEAERAARVRARAQLARTLAGTGIARLGPRVSDEQVVDAAIDAVARAPAPLALVPLEDLLGAGEQPNLPGTIGQHPNWRRRYPGAAARLLAGAAARRRIGRLARARNRHR